MNNRVETELTSQMLEATTSTSNYCDVEGKESPRSCMQSIQESSSTSRRKCLVLYTGGTFGMTPDDAGVLQPTTGFLQRKIDEMDEFKFTGMPQVTVTEWEEPIDSSDMCPDDWIVIARTISDSYFDYDGFVVLQGTDTMAYTASALSFMLENLGKPVVLAGAMIPLHFPHSDARRNLIVSIMAASRLDIPEVCVYSNDRLLRGNRTMKSANMSVDAFDSPNFPVLATTGVETIVNEDILLSHPKRRFQLFTELHTVVCVYSLVPGFDIECIRAYVESKNTQHRAIVFSLYGTGNAPLRHDGFLKLIKKALDLGIEIAVTSQCAVGRTVLSHYTTGIKLLELGVISSEDMTIAALVTKLAYLMGKGFSGKELKSKMEINIRGELSNASDAGSNNNYCNRHTGVSQVRGKKCP